MGKVMVVKGGHEVLFSEQDTSFIEKFTWHLNSNGYVVTSINMPGHVFCVKLHRLLAQVPEGLVVDHINGNILDNRRENLRVCTASQNARNQTRVRNNKSSKYKGVHLSRGKVWAVCIHLNGKRIYLGKYKVEEEAARAYDAAALIYHKEFARLNFPVL